MIWLILSDGHLILSITTLAEEERHWCYEIENEYQDFGNDFCHGQVNALLRERERERESVYYHTEN